MRSFEELVGFVKRSNDIFGFAAEALAPYLPYQQVREFLAPKVSSAEWVPEPYTHETVTTQMRDYMAFAWGKVLAHRGLSAGRSVAKMKAWLYALGDDEMVAFCEDESHYPQYGAPMLKAISEKYGFSIPDDERVRRMVQGLPCSDGCEDGCGH